MNSPHATMYELIDSAPDVEVVEAEYIRLLGYPRGRALDGRAKELAAQTRAWYQDHGRPWLYARELSEVVVSEGEIALEGDRFQSGRVASQFQQAGAHAAFAVAVSAGSECEARAQELWKEGKPDEYFFMEMFGAAVVEHLIMLAGSRLCGWADERGMLALPHYSPGYPEWDISDQVALMKLIRRGAQQPLPGAIQSLDTGMLQPKKSLLGIIGVTRETAKAKALQGLSPCERCSLTNCDYRRMPYLFETYDAAMNEDEAPDPAATGGPGDENGYGLDTKIRYGTNSRALRKWSEERLSLRQLSDGSVEAVFRYDGSTCSNMGYPLKFNYTIKVGPPESGSRILEALCEPAPGDVGHSKMCEYLKRGERFMEEIQRDAPLLGEPLDAIRDWNLPSSYAGCYCEAEARYHKWRIAYEVIHYTLVQRQRAKGADLTPAR